MELVRMLAIDIGIRPAARKLGVNEDTACKWAERYHWNISGVVKPGPVNSVSNLSASPADVLANVMAERRETSKSYLSEYVVNASREAAKSKRPLKDARAVRDVQATHAGLWPEQVQAASQTLVNVNIVNR